MKNDNEAKMKEILDELEDELLSGDLANKEEIEELEVKPTKKNKKKYKFNDEGIVIGEDNDVDVHPSKYKFSEDGIVIGEPEKKNKNKYKFNDDGIVVGEAEKKQSKKKKYKFDEKGVVVDEYDDDALEVEYEFDKDGFVIGELSKDKKEEPIKKTDDIKEKVEENHEEETSEEELPDETDEVEEKEEKKEEIKSDEEIDVKESPIRTIGNYLIEKLKKYKYVIILDIVVFLFLFFLIPAIILEVKPVVWMTLFLVFTILPTVAFYLGRLFQKYQILFSIPFLYLCILCVLDNCTIKDLYGITSHGGLDKTPAWIDAILVMFIIVFFQYIGLCAIDLARKYLKKGNNKDDKREEKTKKNKKDKKKD